MKRNLKRMVGIFVCFCIMLNMVAFSAAASESQSSTEEVTRYCVLILDTSGSMSGTPISVQKEAAAKFCESVLAADGTNYVAIVKLNSSASVMCQFTSDLDTLTDTIDRTRASGGTNTNAALEEAGALLDEVEDDSVIKNIVLCSDGLPESGTRTTDGRYTSQDHSSYYQYANTAYNTATELKESCNIYTLGFFHSLSGTDLDFGEVFMQDLASAGCYYQVQDVDDLVFTFGEIAESVTSDEDKDPIIIVPGIMGSRLFTSSTVFNDSTRIWDPVVYVSGMEDLVDIREPGGLLIDSILIGGTIANLDKLSEYVASDNVYVRPTINEQDFEKDEGDSSSYGREYGAQDTYKNLVDELCDQFEDRDIYFFSYDWRKGNEASAEELREFINSLGTKVDLVCHSMGGLVASSYYQNYASDGYIDKIITLGTPYEGAPKLINSVMNWDVLGEGLTSEAFADGALAVFGGLKTSVKASFLGVAELIPTENYISEIPMWQDSLAPFSLFDYEMTYEEYAKHCVSIFGQSNYDSTLAFQRSLLADSGEYEGYNVLLGYENAYFAIGINQKTITAIKFQLTNDDVDQRLYESDLDYDTKGDGTVPYLSASIMEQIETLDESRYKTFTADHSGLVQNATSIVWAVDLLRTGESDAEGDTQEENSYIVVRIACPVDVEVTYGGETLTSAAGSITTATTSFGRMDILGENDDIKMLCIDDADDYDIILSGTAAGTMEYTIRFYDEDGTLYDERTAEDVPVTEDTVIHTGSDNSGEIVLEIDEDGDGTADDVVATETVAAYDDSAEDDGTTDENDTDDDDNDDNGDGSAACTHQYEVTDSVEATCDTTGYRTYTCKLCGDTYTETIPATGHGDTLIVVYENNETEIINNTTYNSTTSNSTTNGGSTTTNSSSVTYWYCPDCGQFYSDEALTTTATPTEEAVVAVEKVDVTGDVLETENDSNESDDNVSEISDENSSPSNETNLTSTGNRTLLNILLIAALLLVLAGLVVLLVFILRR